MHCTAASVINGISINNHTKGVLSGTPFYLYKYGDKN